MELLKLYGIFAICLLAIWLVFFTASLGWHVAEEMVNCRVTFNDMAD